jgi:hypothetical protein
MLFIKKISVLCVLFSCLLVLHSCEKETAGTTTTSTTSSTGNTVIEEGLTFTSPGTLTVTFNHQFKEKALQLAPTSYVTNANDTVRFTEIRYYITNVELTTKAGTKVNLGNANLIDFLPPNTSSFSINNIPVGNYTSLSYLIGVDSIRNSGGVQEGDLDPSNGMFWTWNTGYVFLRCKGRFGIAESAFSLDIGGTRNLMVSNHSLIPFKKSGTSATINFNMDIANMFNTPNSYSLITDPADIHTAGSSAIAKLKPNIINAFSIKDIQ